MGFTRSTMTLSDMPCISIYSDDLDQLEYFKSHINESESTNHIYLRSMRQQKRRVF